MGRNTPGSEPREREQATRVAPETGVFDTFAEPREALRQPNGGEVDLEEIADDPREGALISALADLVVADLLRHPRSVP